MLNTKINATRRQQMKDKVEDFLNSIVVVREQIDNVNKKNSKYNRKVKTIVGKMYEA